MPPKVKLENHLPVHVQARLKFEFIPPLFGFIQFFEAKDPEFIEGLRKKAGG